MTMPCVIPSYGDEPPADVVFIRVEPYTGVDLEFFKVGSFDYDGSCLSMRDLTIEDIKRWNLWDYFNEDDFDDNGELILP